MLEMPGNIVDGPVTVGWSNLEKIIPFALCEVVKKTNNLYRMETL